MKNQQFSDTLDAGSASVPQPTNAQMGEVVELGERLATLRAAVAATEVVASRLRGEAYELETKIIPDKMMELRMRSAGLSGLTRAKWLEDGALALERAAKLLRSPPPDLLKELNKIAPEGDVAIEIDDYYKANIAADWEADRRQAAFDWLDKNKAGALIKVEVSATFPRGLKKLADKVVAAMRKALGDRDEEVDVRIGLSVPWNTLTAFVKTEMRAGRSLPLETLGASVGKVARLVQE